MCPVPRFSIIVPAYRVQAYLSECLDSLLDQSHDDFEVIAVNDRSPDSCGEIIDAYAARDPRVIALHLPDNRGLGPARNAGIARATGDYLLFLDGDDTMVPGSLAAIGNRLDVSAEPDVLAFDYARVHWWGQTERNVKAQLLASRGSGPDGAEVFNLRQRPELLGLLAVVWNKAYRRAFITDQGFTFPPGYYEDLPWTYPVLLTAPRIAVLDRVCVHYRQRRQGNILRTESRRHFDVFDQYERVFAFLRAHPELAEWHAPLFQRMIEHLLKIDGLRSRIPARARAEFRGRCTGHFHRYKPLDYSPPPGWRGLRHRLVDRGAHRLYDLLRALVHTARWLHAQGLRLARRLRAAVVRVYYRVQRMLPVETDLAVFAAYWNDGYVCNPAAIHAKLRQLAPQIRTMWVIRDDATGALPGGTVRLRPGSLAFWRAMARARYLVNNVNFPNAVVKRPGTIHLQTHHGTPLKRMGLDLRDRPAGAAGTNLVQLLARVDRWDYSLSANRHSTLVWERAYPAGYTTLEYGYPRNDVFHTATAQDVVNIRRSLGIPDGATAILYAPTHRDYRTGFRPWLDLERFSDALGEQHVLMVRAHHSYRSPALLPAAGGVAATAGRGLILDVSRHPSVEELCLASDVLVTDYSSIMFDYANLDRPIVLFTADWEVYRQARGVYFDVLAEPPGVVTRTEQELVEAFRSGEWRGAPTRRLHAAFRERYCPYDDGLAAERVVRRVFLGEMGGFPTVVPTESRTPAPSPQRALRALTRGGPGPGPDARGHQVPARGGS